MAKGNGSGKLDGTRWTQDGYELELQPFKTMGAIMDFQDVAASGNLKAIMGECAKVVVKWPHAGDPSDVKAYRDLEISEWSAVQGVVVGAISNFLSSTAGVDL